MNTFGKCTLLRDAYGYSIFGTADSTTPGCFEMAAIAVIDNPSTSLLSGGPYVVKQERRHWFPQGKRDLSLIWVDGHRFIGWQIQDIRSSLNLPRELSPMLALCPTCGFNVLWHGFTANSSMNAVVDSFLWSWLYPG